ncbi:MAG: tetratricopeptide repeat protein [bacterium]|nr:tetratricopeptide repeat protein [bacterium]
MVNLLLRALLLGLLVLSAPGCAMLSNAETPAAAPAKEDLDRLNELAEQNKKLLEQNRELANELEEIRKLRQTDLKESERRLEAMEQTIRMVEQNLQEGSTPPKQPSAPAPVAPATQSPTALPNNGSGSLSSIPTEGLAAPSLAKPSKGLAPPKMEPLPAKDKIPEPDNKVFVVPSMADQQAKAQAQAKEAPKGPEVLPMPSAEPQPEELPTPAGSAAIVDAPLKPKGPKVQASLADQLTGPKDAGVESLSVQDNEIWEDPDLNVPVSPIGLQVFPAAKRAYNEAFKAYTRKDYNAAAEQFDFFLSRYPNDIDADNAQFWRGMAFYDMGRLDEAEEEFRKVLKNYEHGETRRGFKTPDAVLMLAKIYLRRQKPIRARYYFQWITEKFPESRSADKAQHELNAMGGLGGS